MQSEQKSEVYQAVKLPFKTGISSSHKEFTYACIVGGHTDCLLLPV